MLDKIINEKIMSIQSPILTKIFTFITYLDDKYTIAILSLLILIILFRKKEYLKSKILVLALALGVILSQGLKMIIERDRPLIMLIPETGYSFPSNHSTLSMVFFGMIIYLFKDEIKDKFKKNIFVISNATLILLIGFSRIYLSVHWFTDVIFGFTLGLICIYISIISVKKIKFLRKNKLF